MPMVKKYKSAAMREAYAVVKCCWALVNRT